MPEGCAGLLRSGPINADGVPPVQALWYIVLSGGMVSRSLRPVQEVTTKATEKLTATA
jgi:hypothetical protein